MTTTRDEVLALAEELREFTALKYAGDCKCGKCQLVPRELIDRLYAALRASPIQEREAAFPPGWLNDQLEKASLRASEMPAWMTRSEPLSPPAGNSGRREQIASAIRTFCNSLGAGSVQMSHGVERIYYAGISLDALSVAVELALSTGAPGGRSFDPRDAGFSLLADEDEAAPSADTRAERG